jgi:hypothetical protein
MFFKLDINERSKFIPLRFCHCLFCKLHKVRIIRPCSHNKATRRLDIPQFSAASFEVMMFIYTTSHRTNKYTIYKLENKINIFENCFVSFCKNSSDAFTSTSTLSSLRTNWWAVKGCTYFDRPPLFYRRLYYAKHVIENGFTLCSN